MVLHRPIEITRLIRHYEQIMVNSARLLMSKHRRCFIGSVCVSGDLVSDCGRILMIQKVMRIVLAINLLMFVVLVVKLGSPLGHFGRPALENFIAAWWFLSTLAVLILFVLRIVNWRRREDSRGLW